MPPQVSRVWASSAACGGHGGAPVVPIQLQGLGQRMQAQHLDGGTFLERSGEPPEPQTNPSTWGTIPPAEAAPQPRGAPEYPKAPVLPCPTPQHWAPYPMPHFPHGDGVRSNPWVTPPSLTAPGGHFGARMPARWRSVSVPTATAGGDAGGRAALPCPRPTSPLRQPRHKAAHAIQALQPGPLH